MPSPNIQIAQRCIASGSGQDRIFVRVFEDVAILAIADGVGGRAGGGEAAQTVVEEAAKIAQKVRNPREADFWADWLTQIDLWLDADAEAGETTAVVAAIGADFVAGASVGDSSAWLIGDDDWHDLTENQNRKPFLGLGAASPVPFSARCNSETLLLATDGLTKYADWDRLVSIARGADIEAAADDLTAAVRLPSGGFFDDVSCILCRNVER